MISGHSPERAETVGEFQTEADALLDRLEITCELHLSAPAAPSERAAAWGRLEAGLLGPRGRVGFVWTCPRSGEELVLGGRMVPAGSGTRCVATSASVLRINPLAYLRRQVDHDCGPALDGTANVVGPPEADRPHLLGLQLLTVAGIVDAFVVECGRATGVPLLPRLFVRQAELNRDLVRADAPALMRRIAAAPSHWFRRGSVALYRPAPDTAIDGELAVATWRNDRDDAPIRFKFYAKTRDLLRVEVVLDNRRAVELLGWGGLPPGAAGSGAELAARLRRLAEASAPVLTDMAEHVAGFGPPAREVLDLLAALSPLLQLAAPPPPSRAGGRPGSATTAHARRAVEMLLSTGRFDASDVPTNSQMRKKLRDMTAYGALLFDPHGRAPLFALAPGLQPARLSLAELLVPRAARPMRKVGGGSQSSAADSSEEWPRCRG